MLRVIIVFRRRNSKLNVAVHLHERSVSESAAVTVKANQAKAARKARGRGVSGTMSKKDKSVTCGRFTSLSEWDDCYEVNFDDDEHYTSSDDECVFNEAADGEFNGEKWGRGRLGLMDNQLAFVTATLDAAAKASELRAMEKDASEELMKGEYDRHEVTAETVRTDSELIAEDSTLGEGLMKDKNVHTSNISEG
ncbi:unnamed protein product [Toxocara canis]|uniref:Uncharacterized protein n=1 Tax=Toxocara canis TaxID=6265 RepID=A0A3P7GIL2_TOXCA|nr:unnamed protein product [Toxocara canis]